MHLYKALSVINFVLKRSDLQIKWITLAYYIYQQAKKLLNEAKHFSRNCFKSDFSSFYDLGNSGNGNLLEQQFNMICIVEIIFVQSH